MSHWFESNSIGKNLIKCKIFEMTFDFRSSDTCKLSSVSRALFCHLLLFSMLIISISCYCLRGFDKKMNFFLLDWTFSTYSKHIWRKLFFSKLKRKYRIFQFLKKIAFEKESEIQRLTRFRKCIRIDPKLNHWIFFFFFNYKFNIMSYSRIF